MTYSIHEDNMPRLTKKLNTVQNKCRAYGCEFSFEVVGEEHKKVEGEFARFVVVEVNGTARVENWEFIATLQHMNPINIVRNFRTEVEVPARYYTAEPTCEHCNSKRNRADTYVIRNTETGEFKQVGKNCLKDFTGGLSAEAVARYISWFDEVIKGEAPSGSSYTRYYKTVEVLQYAVEAVRLYGYHKAQNDYGDHESTGSVAFEELTKWRHRKERPNFNVDHEGNEEKAQQILDWVHGLEPEFGYLSNLKAACAEYCNGRTFNLVVSAVAAYNRAMDKQKEREAKAIQQSKSTWVGTEGERINLGPVECKLLSAWDTAFGITRLYQFTTPEGNVLVWKTGAWLEEGMVPGLRATVKGHSNFRGCNQTELTRCKVMEKAGA